MENTISVLSKNVTELRDALGLSQKDFALLSNISAPTLVNIESGRKTFKIHSLEGILNFTTIALDEISRSSFSPPKNLRDKLIEKYKDDAAVAVLLKKEPTISYCIKYKLLQSNFLSQPRETNEIRQFFETLGWDFKGNSIHTALKRLPNEILIEKHPLKQNTNVYSKK